MPILLLCTLLNNAVAQQKSKQNAPTLANSIFWKIISPTGKINYLYGTMHVSNKIAFKLPDTFYNAIKNVDIVALESDPSTWARELDAESDLKFVINSSRSTEEIVTTRKYYNYYENLFSPKKISIPYLASQFRYKPIDVNSSLFRSYGNANLEEETYLDLYIYKTGKRFGKAIASLEDVTWSLHQMMMASLDYNARDHNTSSYTYTGGAKALQNAYRDNNLMLIDSLTLASSDSQYVATALHSRNDTMVYNFNRMVNSGKSIFAAIGCAHLPGSRGVLAQLQKLGYKIAPVEYNKSFNPNKKMLALDSMYLPVQHKSYASMDSTLIFSMPAYPSTTKIDGKVEYLATDMSNGTYYYVGRKQHLYAFTGQPVDSLFLQLDSMAYENTEGSILHKGKAKYKSYDCYEVESKTKDNKLIKQRIIYTPLELIIMKCSAPLSYTAKFSMDTFFDGLQLQYKKNIVHLSSADTTNDIDALLPISVRDNHFNAQIYYATDKMYSGIDSNGNIYAYMRSIHNQGIVVEEDSFHVCMMANAAACKLGLTVTDVNFSRYQQLPMATLQAKNYKQKPVTMMVITCGTSIHYFLKNSALPAAASLLSSLNFYTKKIDTASLYTYTDSTLGYALLAPGPAYAGTYNSAVLRTKKITENNAEANHFYYAGFILRQENVFINKQNNLKLNVKYYDVPACHAYENIDSFWAQLTRRYEVDDDGNKLTCAFKIHPNKMRVDVDIYNKKSSCVYKGAILLHNNHMLSLGLTIDTTKQLQAAQSCFGSVKWLSADSGTSFITSSKLDTFLHYSLSNDSSVKKYSSHFEKNFQATTGDIPRILALLDSAGFAKKESDLAAVLVYELNKQHSPKVLSTLESLYNKLESDAALQCVILNTLLQQYTKESYKLFAKLVSDEPPIINNTDYSSDDYIEFYNIGEKDSLKHTQLLFPAVLSLLDYDEYKQAVLSLICRSVKEKLIDSAAYTDRIQTIVLAAKQQYRKTLAQDTRLELEAARLEKINEVNTTEEAQDYNKSTLYYKVNDSLETVSNLPTLEYDQLQEYIPVISPFKYKRSVTDLLSKIDTCTYQDYLFGKTAAAIKDSTYKVDKEILLAYQSLPEFAYRIPYLASIHKLEDAKRYKVSNQQDAARLYCIEVYSLTEQDTIKFVKKITIKNNKQDGVGYVFKVHRKKAKEPVYMLAGMFSKNSTELFIKEELQLEANSSTKKTDEQIANLLEVAASYNNRAFLHTSDVHIDNEEKEGGGFFDFAGQED